MEMVADTGGEVFDFFEREKPFIPIGADYRLYPLPNNKRVEIRITNGESEIVHSVSYPPDKEFNYYTEEKKEAGTRIILHWKRAGRTSGF